MSSEFSALHKEHLGQVLDFLNFDKEMRAKILEDVKEELKDLFEARITAENTYTGAEIVDALDDVPDRIESVIDRELEHQRDVTMVMIRNIFEQAKAKNKDISLSVSKLEDEKMVNASHAFCGELIAEPEKAMESAPDAAASPATGPVMTGDPAKDALILENAKLREQIEAEVKAFPQYQKTLEMVHQREVEIRGLKARL